MDDDEVIGDDLLTPGAGARKLYENIDPLDALGNINKSGGGSWLLRTGLGGNSLGEKLGEAIEIAAYKGMFFQLLPAAFMVHLINHHFLISLQECALLSCRSLLECCPTFME
jgi:hypothetical protein